MPQVMAKVQVHFVGKVVGEEKEFHSTHASGHAVSFLLGTGQTIKGLEVALLAMRAGSRAVVVIGPEYGYGNRGRTPLDDEPEVPPGATLEYEISLISFLVSFSLPPCLSLLWSQDALALRNTTNMRTECGLGSGEGIEALSTASRCSRTIESK